MTQVSLKRAEFNEAIDRMLYDFGRLERLVADYQAEVAQVKADCQAIATENARLEAELAQARQWAGLWRRAARKYWKLANGATVNERLVDANGLLNDMLQASHATADQWRNRALAAERLIAVEDDEQHDNVPAYTEETG